MKVTVKVCEVEQYDSGFPESKLVETVKWFQEKLEQIPEQYREEARCEIDIFRSYEDSAYSNIKISYQREATEEEIKAEKTRIEANRIAQIKWAEDNLAKLKAMK